MDITYTAEDFSGIRRLADPTMMYEDMPDAVLSQESYIGTAEQWVYTHIPDADTATGGDLTAIKRAVIHKTAAILLETSPVVRMGRMSEQNFQIENGDTLRRIEALHRTAAKILSTVSIKPVRVSTMATLRHFTVARPARRTW